MNMLTESFIILIPATALVSSLLIYLFRNDSLIIYLSSIIASILMFIMVIILGKEVYLNENIIYDFFSISQTINIKFVADKPAILFASIASFLWIITNFYSIGYLKGTKDKKIAKFFYFFALTLFATTALAFSANLITLFFFYELITIFTYPLVTHKGDTESIKAGRKYFAYLIGLSLFFFLVAIFLTYNLKHILDFHETGIFDGSEDKKALLIILIMFLFGIAKAAIMPAHSWLPTAMVAPTPVSALLHAVAVVKAGVFSLYRVLNNVFTIDVLFSINGHYIIIIFASITIIVASIIALRQDNLKLMLAYSTVSQLSYIVLSFGLLNKVSIIGGLSHMLTHAFSKITLFFCAGAIYVTTHKTKISELDGIGRKMPLTMTAFTIGSLSIIGMPLFAGFISKFLILKGVYYSNMYSVFVIFGSSTLLNTAYFFPIIYKAFMKVSKQDNEKYKEAEPFLLYPLLVTAFFTVLLFFLSSFIFKFLGDL